MSQQQESPRLPPPQPGVPPEQAQAEAAQAAHDGPGAAGATGRRVFRGPGAVALWWAWLFIAAVSLGDLAVQGRDHTSAVAAAVVIAITGVLYASAQRPRIIADADGVTVANPVREYTLAWGAIERVDVKGSLRVHCVPAAGGTSATVIHSWAVQGSPHGSARRELAAGRKDARARKGRRPPAAPSPPVRRGPDRISAEYVAAQLTERKRRAQATGAGGPGGPPQARWVWESAAAMLVPLLLLIAVVLA